jgi:hypothetical protein
MTTGKKLLIGAGVAAGAGFLFYRLGINDLQFSIDGYVPGPNGSIQMRIKVTNPSRLFGYPVPQMLVNAFDSSGSFVGTIINQQLQWIAAGTTSYIYGTVQPNYQNLVSIIMSVIQGGGLPTGLTFHGMIRVGRIEIPFQTDANMSGVGCNQCINE